MNKTAELVSLWAAYEEQHPDAGLKDFYSDQLLAGRKAGKKKFLGGLVPSEGASLLAKLLGRLVKLHTTYAMVALKEKGIGSFEEFTFLMTMLIREQPKKSEVVNENFVEFSSGLLVIDRLKASGFVAETEDQEDRRSKRVHLTAKGRKKVEECQQVMDRFNRRFYQDLHKSDIDFCIDMFKPLEIKYSSLWQKHGKKGMEKVPLTD